MLFEFLHSQGKKNPSRNASYSALLDSSTYVLLALSKHISAVQFLQEATPGSVHTPVVQYPNYRQSFPLAKAHGDTYPEWAWDWKTRLFSETKPELVTTEMRFRSHLAIAKLTSITRILSNINIIRYPVRTGIDFQETVYLVKRMQAQAFKDAGFDEDFIHEYPYVLQYADFAEIPLKQAAEEILFKAKLDDEILAQSELLRLRYFNKVKNASTPEELPPITAAFVKDCYNTL